MNYIKLLIFAKFIKNTRNKLIYLYTIQCSYIELNYGIYIIIIILHNIIIYYNYFYNDIISYKYNKL